MSSNIQGNSSDECGECRHTQNLPADCYAKVLEYSSFDTVLACGATCRTILHDAMPLLSKIYIDRSSQMNLTIASRFRDIKEIHINSLFELTIDEEGTEDEYMDMRIDFDTKTSVVPFLAKFDSLERVVFGIKKGNGHDIDGTSPADCYFYEGDGDSYPDEAPRTNMLALLDMFSGAYKVGALQKNIQISGLCCPDSTDQQGMRGNNCSICTRACKHFPLESVVEFECRGTSSNNALSLRSHGLDVCLESAKIESIIETRPGGKELLRSDKRLLYLLGRGRRYIIPSNEGEEDVQKKALHIVKYKQEELDEITRVINYAELDVKKLSIESVSDAIRQSFVVDNGITPSEDQCYISDSSLGYLNNNLGLPINKEDFERPLTDLMGHTQQIVWALNQCDLLVNEDGTRKERELHKDIELDCLRLVRRFLEVESNPPIQQRTKAIPTLTNRLERGSDEYIVEAATSLQHILTKGTADQRKMIADKGISSLCQLLDSTNDSIVTAALLSLTDIAYEGTADDIRTISDAGAIPCTVDLLSKNDDDSITKNSLLLLVAAKDHIKDGTQAALLPQLVNMIKKDATAGATKTSATLILCSILLRKVLETKNQERIQIVIDSIVPKLIEMMKSTKGDGIVQTNMSHVTISLLSGSKEQVDMLVKDTDLLHKLVSLIKSGHKAPLRGEQPPEQPSSPLPSVRSPKSSIKRTVIRLPHNDKLGLTLQKNEDGSIVITGVDKGGQGEKYGCRVGEVPVVISKGEATKIPYQDFLQQCKTRPVVFSVLRPTQNEGKNNEARSATSSPPSMPKSTTKRIDMEPSSSEFSSHLLKKAIDIVGKVANMATEYRDLLLQMGIMESLKHVLDNKPPPHITKAVAWSFEQFCSGKPVDFDTSQAWLKVIPQLFLSNEAEVIAHACEALFRILNSLKEDELNQVIGMGLVDLECLLKKLPFAPNVQQAAFKSIHLISTGDDGCIKAIVDRNGVNCISKTLLDEKQQVLACQALLSLLSHDEGLVQTAIDNNVHQGLLQMLKCSKETKKLALTVIHQMTKTRDSTQIKRLVSTFCVQKLCEVLTDDCDVAIIALQSLNDILNVGKDEEMQKRESQFGNQIPSKSVQETERKLDMLMDEIKQLEQQDECVVLLQRKKAWLEFHIQNERVSSITKAIELLKRQKKETAASFESIKDDVYVKGDDTMKCFEKQIKSAEIELSAAQTKLDLLEKEAEKGAHPVDIWAKGDLSTELELVTSALERAKVKLESMISFRSDRSAWWYAAIGPEIGRLFIQDFTQPVKENELGQTQQQQTQAGSTVVPYSTTTKQDGNNSIVLQSITAMPQYEQKSFEELRLEDYMAGNKGAPFGGFESRPNVRYASRRKVKKLQSRRRAMRKK